MKNRLLCLVLAVAFVLVAGASAEEYGGEMFKLRGYTDGTLNVDSIFMDPHDGPGYEYYPVTMNLPQGTVVRVLTQATDSNGNRWVLAESGNIRAYLIQRDSQGQTLISCDLSTVPEEPTEFYSVWACLLYEDCDLFFGPGTDYQRSSIRATTEGSGYVVLMNGDWALVEFQGGEYGAPWLPDDRKTRGWIPFSNLVY